jgi:CRP/FNR family transcriptional regulator
VFSLSDLGGYHLLGNHWSAPSPEFGFSIRAGPFGFYELLHTTWRTCQARYVSDHENLFRSVPLLARLAPADLKALASKGRVRSYRSGAVIFGQGERGDSLHVVVSGAVRVNVLSATGEEATLALLGPGECVGDLSLLDGRPRSASAVASGTTKTLMVTRNDFAQWLATRPKAGLALLETLALRVRRTDEALADLAFLDLPRRLAKQLLELARAHPEVQSAGQGGGMRLRITQAELAAMLGVSRESVNKQLNALAREGVLQLGRGSVTLLDMKALADQV